MKICFGGNLFRIRMNFIFSYNVPKISPSAPTKMAFCYVYGHSGFYNMFGYGMQSHQAVKVIRNQQYVIEIYEDFISENSSAVIWISLSISLDIVYDALHNPKGIALNWYYGLPVITDLHLDARSNEIGQKASFRSKLIMYIVLRSLLRIPSIWDSG